MVELSIFLAAIRPQNWRALYDSMSRSSNTNREFEMIFVSPYDLPENMKGLPNVKLIKDFGCPSRCYQLGLLACEGEYVIPAVDDGIFTANSSIDLAFQFLESMSPSKKNMVVFKYNEGLEQIKKLSAKLRRDHAKVRSDPNFWRLGFWFHNPPYTDINCTIAPDDYFLIMSGLMNREFLLELGGFDCQFEHLGIGMVDFSIRVQNAGANTVLGEEFMALTTEWNGEHLPIEQAQSEHDIPLFIQIYSDPASSKRSNIDIDNWKQAEEKWSRRFK